MAVIVAAPIDGDNRYHISDDGLSPNSEVMKVKDCDPYVTDAAAKPPRLESPTIRIGFGPEPTVCDHVRVEQLGLQDALAVESNTIDVLARTGNGFRTNRNMNMTTSNPSPAVPRLKTAHPG